MNARRRSLRCLALCALPVAAVLAAVPAQAAGRDDSTNEAVHAGALPLAGGAEAATEAEGTAEPESTAEPEGATEGGAEAEHGAGDGKDNGLGIGIIAASLVFGALAAPVIKLASLKQG